MRKFFPIAGGVQAAGGAFGVRTSPGGVHRYSPNASAIIEVALVAKGMNGSGAYTYAWAIVGDSQCTIDGATNTATALIKITGTGSPLTYNATATVTATDVGTGLTATYDAGIEVQLGGSQQ